MNRGAAFGIASAVLFGMSTPLAKLLVGPVPPLLLAGLLYLGAGFGLLLMLLVRRIGSGQPLNLPGRTDLPWLAGAILAGGMLGPVALMYGLTRMPAAPASLLLNLEAVIAALLAWFVFHESVDMRVGSGMLTIVLGGVVLAWTPLGDRSDIVGPLLVATACFFWAVDNNLTRKVSASDAMAIACAKGLVAGMVNTGLAIALGQRVPAVSATVAAALVGLLGYGISLSLFILALRHVGTARAAAYFSIAPFFGAALALPLLDESLTWQLAVAGSLMGVGVWLHLTERHQHIHAHEALEHTHSHTHDEHHAHPHDFDWDGRAPHVHAHRHPPMIHAHVHYPDLHHRHGH